MAALSSCREMLFSCRGFVCNTHQTCPFPWCDSGSANRSSGKRLVSSGSTGTASLQWFRWGVHPVYPTPGIGQEQAARRRQTTEAQRKHREESSLTSLCFLCVSVPLL